ncbi:lysophospholipid acyltransferase family protein [Pseudoxanthobacter sp. M-2]|uniref:lysophospholipid acyltransferase family protein n=1 Tax=Pseudoxanthobacter sp. M-2 TaxID=3078754 RepID=UPI0038FBEAC6
MTAQLFSYANPGDPKVRRLTMALLERALGVSRLTNGYQRWRSELEDPSVRTFDSMLELCDIDLVLAGRWPLARLPDGPLLVVSNHPFGIGDGIALGAIAERFGRPFKLLINQRLARVPEIEPYILPLSFDESREAVEMNIATRHEAVRLLKAGGTVGIFPGGGVATAPRGYGAAEELPWKKFLPKLVQMGGANVLPIYMHGQNSLLFQAASRVSLTARRALLCREFVRQLGSPIHVQVGEVMAHRELAAIRDRNALLEHIQRAVLSMRPHDARSSRPAILDAKRRHPLWKEDAVCMTNSLKWLREKPAAGDVAETILPRS